MKTLTEHTEDYCLDYWKNIRIDLDRLILESAIKHCEEDEE